MKYCCCWEKMDIGLSKDLEGKSKQNSMIFSVPGIVLLPSLLASSSPDSFFTSSAAGSDNFASFKSTDCVSWAGRRPAALFFKPCAMPASTAPTKEQNNTLLLTTPSERDTFETSNKCLSQRDVCLIIKESTKRSKERQEPTLGVRLIERQLKRVKKGRDQL